MKIPVALKKLAKKHKVKLTLKKNGKRIYKTEKVIRKQIKKKIKKKSKKTKVKFGELSVPNGMKTVSQVREGSRGSNPLLIAPFGPRQPWLIPREQPAYSGVPGNNNKVNKTYGVTPSGYLSLWNGGYPRVPPPRWNPLLLQGGNNFPMGKNYPKLSDVV